MELKERFRLLKDFPLLIFLSALNWLAWIYHQNIKSSQVLNCSIHEVLPRINHNNPSRNFAVQAESLSRCFSVLMRVFVCLIMIIHNLYIIKTSCALSNELTWKNWDIRNGYLVMLRWLIWSLSPLICFSRKQSGSKHRFLMIISQFSSHYPRTSLWLLSCLAQSGSATWPTRLKTGSGILQFTNITP